MCVWCFTQKETDGGLWGVGRPHLFIQMEKTSLFLKLLKKLEFLRGGSYESVTRKMVAEGGLGLDRAVAEGGLGLGRAMAEVGMRSGPGGG